MTAKKCTTSPSPDGGGQSDGCLLRQIIAALESMYRAIADCRGTRQCTTQFADDLIILGERSARCVARELDCPQRQPRGESTDGLKVGGHQASSASLATIMTALYFGIPAAAGPRRVKRCVAEFHAIEYLLGKQTREKLANFRGYKGAQSDPSRTKDTDDVDFSTGSVGLGVAQTCSLSLVQDYVRAHGWGLDRGGRPHGCADGRCGSRRGQHLRVPARSWKQGSAELLVDRRLQPAKSRRLFIREGLWQRYESCSQFRLGRS